MLRSRSRLRLELLESRALPAVNILADVQPSRPNSSDPRNFVPLRDMAVFVTNAGLWQTDGTETGTTQFPWIQDANILSERNGLLIAEGDNEVWRSDGTEAGTFLLGPGQVVGQSADTLYLAQTEREFGAPLTIIAANITTGELQVLGEDIGKPSFTLVNQVAVAGDVPVISHVIADDRPFQYTLSRIGEQNELAPIEGPEFSNIVSLTGFDGSVYFLARFKLDGSDRHGLFETDGNSLRRIQDFPPELYDREVLGGLWATDETLFVKIADSERSLKTYYLTTDSRELRPLLLQDDDCGLPCGFHEIGDHVAVTADQGVWSFDAATGATERLISRQMLDSPFAWPAWINGSVAYFAFQDAVYQTDGTVDGTTEFTRTADARVAPWRFAVVSNRLVFGNVADEDGELWVSDVTDDQVRLLKNIDPSRQLLNISIRQQLALPNGDFYFQIDDGSEDLWVTRADSTSAQRVTGFSAKLEGTTLQGNDFGDLRTVGNQLCFNVRNEDETFSMWTTDGTPANTEPLVESVEQLFFDRRPSVHGRLGFRTREGDQEAVWFTQCTAGTTFRIAAGLELRSEVIPFGTNVAFVAVHPDVGREVWVSDFTPEGTRPVTTFAKDQIRIASIKSVRDAVYFSAGTDTADVFRIDHDSMTVTPVADLAPSGFEFGVGTLADLLDRVVFRSFDFESTKSVLIVHDLKANETRMLTTTLGHEPRDLQVLSDRAVYAFDKHAAVELWSTDGTERGTSLLWEGPDGERLREIRVADVGGEGLIQLEMRRSTVLLRSNGTPEGTIPVTFESGATRNREYWLPGLVELSDRAVGAFADSVVSLDREGNLARIRIATAHESTVKIVPLSNGQGAVVFVRHENGRYQKIYRTDGTQDGTYLLEKIEDPSSFDRELYFATSASELFFRARSRQGSTIYRTPLTSNADLNADGFLNGEDIDALNAAIAGQVQESQFDLNSNGIVDQEDRLMLIDAAFETSPADLNLDGRVNFKDFLVMSDSFNRVQASWEHGDLNGDGMVDFVDFSILSEEFGFDRFVRDAWLGD